MIRTSLGRLTAAVCAVLLVPPSVTASSWQTTSQTKPATTTASTSQATSKIPNDQLDSLVAPIALYPDPMLAQVLAASTYPLEIVQLQQWMAKNPELKDEKLAAAVEKQGWDPAIQGLAGLPEVVKRLGDDIKWTTDLGNAFLAQQQDVMDAVQRMRKKASDGGHLKTNEQQKVTTKVVETKQVIVIEQANPQVVYVPSYNPVVVYGAPIYPYPPIYYPPYGYYAAGAAIGFSVGIMMGAFWGGGWGYGCGWGGGSVHINVNNRYVNHYNRNNVGNRYGGNNNNWSHRPEHRGGAPYGDRGTADRFGGTARGDSLSSRQNAARTNQTRSNSLGSGSGANRASPGTSSLGSSSRGSSGLGSGGDRVGNRSVPSGSSRSGSAFGGAASSRASGMGARSSSMRGGSSMGSRGGGGRRR